MGRTCGTLGPQQMNVKNSKGLQTGSALLYFYPFHFFVLSFLFCSFIFVLYPSSQVMKTYLKLLEKIENVKRSQIECNHKVSL